MGLLSPTALLWFLPLSAAIIFLYLLKLKRKEKMVPSVMLWVQAVQDVQANAPFQKLRKSLLLFIQLATLLFAVLALARPFVRTVGLAGQNIVLIIDRSASMKATDVSRGRFTQAKRIALQMIDNLGKGDQMMIISAAYKIRVESAFTADKKGLAVSVGALKPTDTRANLRDALILASSLVAKKKHPRIVIISDGAFPKLVDVRIRAPVEFFRVGRRASNIGIVAMNSRRTRGGIREVLVALRNFSMERRVFNLEYYVSTPQARGSSTAARSGVLVDVREESLAPDEQKIEILKLPPETPSGLVRAVVDARDDLAADNQAAIFLERPRKLSLLLVTRGNIFLENALNLDPRSEVVKVAFAPADLSMFDVVVFDCITPPPDLPRGNYILINTCSPLGPALPGAVVEVPAIVDWDRKHPALGYVDFSGVGIQTARSLKPMSWGRIILESDAGPLAIAGDLGGRRFLVLGFDLKKSNFVLLPGFPIMMANCLDWFSEENRGTGCISARTGETVPIQIPKSARSITIAAPDGTRYEVPVNASPVFYDGTEQAGIYRIAGRGFQRLLSVNLLWSEESDTRPHDQLFLAERDVRASRGSLRTNRELWRYALIMMFAILCVEWWVYHRRL